MIVKVSNPLTIIAIFAGLAEALATVALVQLPESIQKEFIYFVMLFPTLIVLLFFWVLYTKNTVLYAPSDFDNQQHYLEINQMKESVSKAAEEIFQTINKPATVLSRDQIETIKSGIKKSIEKSALSSYEEKLIAYLKDNDEVSTKQATLDLGMSLPMVLVLLNRFKEDGVVSRNMATRNWKIKT